MISKSKNIIIFTIVVYITVAVGMRWLGFEGTNWKSIIKSDGIGYYQYLNALFIDKNIGKQQADGRYLLEHKNGVANIYPVGTAVLISPFFAEGYFYQWLFMDTVEKYGLFFQLEVSIAALFYFLIALIIIRKSLVYYNIRDEIISVLIITISFGTNLMYYTIFEPSMSHVYSFFTISFFLYSVISFQKTVDRRNIFGMAVALALTILIRPANIFVIVFIPFLIGDFGTLKIFFKNLILKRKTLILAFITFLLIISIQPIMWKLQANQWFIWSYKNSGFYFDSPEIFNFLFSFRKGLFIYTPLTLLSIIFATVLIRKNKFRNTSYLVAIIIVFYFLSSWWNWYYGDSYGMRPMIDYYSIAFLPLAFGLNKLTEKKKFFIYVLIAVFVLLNLIQTYQYYHQIMSRYDMNFEKYKYIFLKTSKNYEGVLGGNSDIRPYHKDKLQLYNSISKNKSFTIVNSSKKFSFNLQKLKVNKPLFAKVSFKAKYEKTRINNSKFLYHLKNEKDEYYYSYSFNINNIPKVKKGVFEEKVFEIQIPPFHNKSSYIVFEFKEGKEKVIVKDLLIELYYPKD